MATALVCYADGSEDLEVTAITDILNRGGVKVIKCAINNTGKNEATLAHGTKVITDINIKECDSTYDLIAIPGGLKGSENCRDNDKLVTLLKDQKAHSRFIGAICAAPGFVLATHNLIGNAKATGYPRCQTSDIKNYSTDGVVIDRQEKIVTGQGPAFAIDFSLALLEVLTNKETAQQVALGMLHHCAY